MTMTKTLLEQFPETVANGRKKTETAQIEPIKDGYLRDFISGQQIVAGKEEVQAVQVFARQLVEDYGYPKMHIRTRPQWRVKARPSDTTKEYPVDIAIFSSEKQIDDQLYIVVECKQRTRRDGITQLEDYMRLSKARMGVWFNGLERLYLRKIEKDGAIHFEEIPNIPQYGQRLEDIGKFKRKDLRTPHNLKSVFQVIRNHLAGNTVGTTRDEELARQLINLVFCKIYDEKFTSQDSIVEFRAGLNEDKETVRGRIEKIFEKVKKKYSEVVDVGDKLALDDNSIVYLVGELQNYCIIDSERDVVADAFETFIGYALKGGQGQFFTPRNVARLMTLIAHPKSDDLVLDPACGSGGFLVESLKYVWHGIDHSGKSYGWSESAIAEEKQAAAIKNFSGLEKDDFLSKVAKAYMAILGDGKGGIFCEDSLDEPKNWKPKTRQHIALGKYDLILTNPPFGKDIKITGDKKLQQYELAHKWETKDGVLLKTNKKRDEQQPDILFIERCLQLLKDGGRMGIILPETFFHAPSAKYVMNFIAQHNIYFVVDLPHNTFRPHNNAKCIAIFLKKNEKQQKEIGMAVVEEMGHDHQGKEIYRWDKQRQKVNKDDLWDDILLIEAELRGDIPPKHTFKVSSKLCVEHGIYVPRYYWQQKEQEIKQIAEDEGYDLVPISDLIKQGVLTHFDGHGSPESENKGNGETPYIRVKDIVNWDVYQDPTAKIPRSVYEAMTTKNVKVTDKDGNTTIISTRNKALYAKDILYVKRGSYRIGSVAMVSPFDTEVLLTREIVVMRVNPDNSYGITPHYMLYAMSHRLVQMQTENKVLIETTLPNIGNRWQQLAIPVPKDKEVLKNISGRIESIIKSKWDAIEQIAAIRKELGSITT